MHPEESFIDRVNSFVRVSTKLSMRSILYRLIYVKFHLQMFDLLYLIFLYTV